MDEITRVTLEPGGWVAIGGWAHKVRVLVREATDGRMEPAGVVLEDGVLSSRLLAQIPFGRIEALVNTPNIAQLIRDRIESPDGHGPVVVETQGALPIQAGRSAMDLLDTVDAILESSPTRYPDEFYELIATLYAFEAARSSRPAARLAQRLDVPVSTMWRWVRVCRDRELLPPARVGKEG